jgi:hypothetical protein
MCDARAGTILVFGQTNTVTPQFSALRSGSSTTLSAADIGVTITNLGGVPSATPALFTLSATNVTPATVDATGHITENFAGTFSIFSGAGQTGTNYLSGTFSDTAFGQGTALTLSASFPGSLLSFTSDVIGALLPPRGMSLAFTDVTPGLSVVDGTLDSFNSNVAGNFSAAVPEPTSVALLGIGLSGLFAFRRFFRRISVA